MKGCQMESGLIGISKILLVESAEKNAQQSVAIDGSEPGYRSDDGNSAEMFNGALVISVAIANHDDAMERYFCTTQGPHCEQSVINRAQGRSGCNQNGKSEMPR